MAWTMDFKLRALLLLAKREPNKEANPSGGSGVF